MIEMSGGEDGLYRLGYAGDTLNTAWYARNCLGEDWSVDYFTAVGDDRYSDEMLSFLDTHNIGTSRIRRISGRRPGLYLIHLEHGDRHFTYWRDVSAAKSLADDAGALKDALNGAELIYFSGITLAILAPPARKSLFEIVETARRQGAKSAFDPNVRPVLWPDKDEMRDAFARAAGVSDFVLPTFGDEAPFFPDADPLATAVRYRGYGAGEVVVKNGDDAAVILSGSDRVFADAVSGAGVVDPTGAGDSFNGAYLSARLCGHDIGSAAARAHAIAAVVIGHKGALVERALLDQGALRSE